jgi:hypothetical protein
MTTTTVQRIALLWGPTPWVVKGTPRACRADRGQKKPISEPRTQFLPSESPNGESMKRLKSRLAALEAQQAASTAATRSEASLLVGILARRDALFWPWRWTIGSQVPTAEIRQRQREYLSGVAGIAAKADGRGDWKNAHELRQSLIGRGWITATHSGGQVTSVFLTAEGEATARALVGDRLHTVETAMPVFIYLKILSERTSCRAVRESVLFNRDCVGNPNDWDHLTEHLLPFLTAGLVEATSDTQGRAAYTPVDGSPVVESIAVAVDADPTFDDAYATAFNAERAALSTVEPRDPSAITIPLPATGWGWPCHFPEETNDEQK